MGKMKRMPERRLRPMYVSVSLLFIAFFLSLSLSTCFLVVLVHVSSLSVHGYSLFFPFGLLLSFLSLFVPPSPFKNVLCSTVILRVSIRLPLFLPFLPTMFGFFFVWFGVIDSARFLAVYL